MKLSVLPVSLFTKMTTGQISIGDWGKFAQELGLDGFDVSISFFPNHTATTINQIKSDIIENNVTIQPTMVCCYPDFTNPDKLERKRQIDYLKRDIALVSDFNFQFVRITAGQNHPGLTIEEGANYCADCFAQVVDSANEYGIKLVFENHSKPGAWPLIDFSFNPVAFLAVYEKIINLPIGINFDTANAVACGADPAILLEKVIDKIWTVHLNDTSTIGHWTPIQIGDGLVDFDSVFRILNAHKYNGCVCIEEASGNGFTGIEKAVNFAKKYVKPVIGT